MCIEPKHVSNIPTCVHSKYTYVQLVECITNVVLTYRCFFLLYTHQCIAQNIGHTEQWNTNQQIVFSVSPQC